MAGLQAYRALSNTHMECKIVNPFTNKESIITVQATQEQMDRYLKGDGLIQNIFVNLSAHERELIKTGIDFENDLGPEE